MADNSTQLLAERRAARGSHSAKKLRREGRVPAVMYGHKEAPISLVLTRDDVWRVIRRNQRIIDLQIDGKKEHCLVREIQWDALGKDVYHVDFLRVSDQDRIKVTVPLTLRGVPPAVAGGTGVLNQPLHQLHIECSAMAVPDSIRVNVGELQINQSIHVRELQLPPGVKVLEDAEEVVVAVVPPAAELPKTPTEGGPVEPELIAKKVAEDKDAGDEKGKK